MITLHLLSCQFSLPIMVTTLELLLKFLRICRLAGRIFWRTLNRWPVLLTCLSRRLSEWWHRKPGTSQTSKPAEPSISGTMAGPSSAIVKGFVSASFVPASASDPTFRRDSGDRFESRSVAAAAAAPSTSGPTRHSVDHPPHAPYSTQFLHGGNPAEGSTSNLSVSSIQSRASDRLSIITANSGKSIRDPVGQPSAHLPKAVHRQFGRGPDASRSRERLSRPPSPASRPPTPRPSPRIVATDLPPSQVFHADGGRRSPIIQPSVSPSHAHEPLGPPPGHENRRKQSSIVVVDVQNPSTESLPIASSPTRTNPRQLTEEPLAMDTTLSSSSSISEFIIPEGRIIQLIHAEQVPRYTKDNTIARDQKPCDIEPLTRTFPYFSETDVPDPSSPGGQDCSPWIPATHPDGGLYFYDPERRIFTDTDMHNPTLKEEIEDFYSYLQKVLRVDQLTIPSGNYDLVLDIMPTVHEKVQWSYYYACHETRCLFWLEKYDGNFMISELDGVESPAHIRHRLEDLYWNHWSLFPAVFKGRRLPRRVYDELMGILTHGCVDMLTSKSSTFPYDDDTMQKMIALVRTAKESRGGVEYYTAGTTRLLSFFAHWRFLHFHGQKHARLVRDLTVYDKPKRERTILITLLSPLLFLAPEVHLQEVEKMWTDDVIIETVWKNFMTKLLGEWEDVILWSTVMLTANVGFLAIPGVVLSNLSGSTLTSASQVVIFTSPSQIASSISVEASIGSIVVGLLLLRHNRTKQKEDPAGAVSTRR
ncbi:hypothetical protein F5148DRAFT_814395 [Russula earlei]|uniref:Uncharacterized protein n=1 Tax=Russula earlei TaxID=71964 RepID=A0ACC0UBP2_9AGAM|nr:hypothetical protein F5148DRAFT_814395 [Russula earlei]